MPETVYIDTCALNRPSDDHSQFRIRQEAEALGHILDLVHQGRVRWLSSTALRYEIERNPDPLRRIRALDLLSASHQTLVPATKTLTHVAGLVSLGFSSMDALHLALAREVGVDWLITTDDRFLSIARRHLQNELPEVINPVNWLQRRHHDFSSANPRK